MLAQVTERTFTSDKSDDQEEGVCVRTQRDKAG